MAAFEVIALDTATPQLRAPGASDTYTFPRAVEMPLGTANGVLYLNGSKVVTSGSALTFDGTNFATTGNANLGSGSKSTDTQLNFASDLGTQRIYLDRGTRSLVFYDATTAIENYRIAGITGIQTWGVGGSEQMRLTSTGLGIGTNNPGAKLDITVGGSAIGVRVNGITGQHQDFYAVRDGSATIQAGPNITLQNPAAASTTYATTMQMGPTGELLFFNYNGSAWNERMRLDSSGNLGLGVTPSAWQAGAKVVEIGGNGYLAFTGNAVGGYLYSNAYFTGTNTYKANGFAAAYGLGVSGAHQWFTAPSGTAGNAISFTQALTLDANRNLLLNGTSAGASAVGTLAIFNGTAPTGSVTDGIILYAEDVSSSSELKVRDEAGNVTTLSPHNFSLIPEGPSEDMAWAYYSEKDGKRINVDMLKLARMVEKLTGEKLVYSA